MSISVQALPINESFLRSSVAAFCTQLDPTVDQLNDIKTALSEAINNAIIHGCDNNPNLSITVSTRISANTVHITVSDQGNGIADINQAKQPFYTTKPELERSGMGFVVMESYMDTVNIISDKNGTTVELTKVLK